MISLLDSSARYVHSIHVRTLVCVLLWTWLPKPFFFLPVSLSSSAKCIFIRFFFSFVIYWSKIEILLACFFFICCRWNFISRCAFIIVTTIKWTFLSVVQCLLILKILIVIFALEIIFMMFLFKDTSNIDYSQCRRVRILASHGIHVSHIYEVKSSRVNIGSMGNRFRMTSSVRKSGTF